MAPGLDALDGEPVSAAIVDLDTPDADAAAMAARERGGSVILLVTDAEELEPGQLELADAVLLRDEVETRTLRLALAAGPLGLRLLPRSFSVAGASARARADATPSLGEPAQRAMQLLAEGLRDAEIALRLNMSESAVRKLIQRAVRRSGARTRCQAVAAAMRSGDLG